MLWRLDLTWINTLATRKSAIFAILTGASWILAISGSAMGSICKNWILVPIGNSPDHCSFDCCMTKIESAAIIKITVIYNQMGSGASHNLIDSNYIEIGKSEHALLSNLTYLEQIYTKQRYMAKQLSFGSEQDYKNYIQRLVQRKKLNNKKISRWVIQLEDYRVLRS